MQIGADKFWSKITPTALGLPMAPLVFSVGIHLFITCIIFVPTSFFQRTTTPEIYTVELVNLNDLQVEPEQIAPSTPPTVQSKPVDQATVSTTPILSTRNIPQSPTKTKILRPRMAKKDLRKDRPPIDQTMVFAALQRLQKMETEQKAQQELDVANEAIERANEEVLQALRESILSRQPQDTGNSNSPTTASTQQVRPNSNSQGGTSGRKANSIRTQYIATIGHHIGQKWHLPEGQKWDHTLKTVVIVKIKTDGIVLSSKIAESSQSKQFDKFVLETIDKASPLPPFPPSLENKPLKLYFYPQGLQ